MGTGPALTQRCLATQKSEGFFPSHGQDRHGRWKRGHLAYLSGGQRIWDIKGQLTKKTWKGALNHPERREAWQWVAISRQEQSETARTVQHNSGKMMEIRAHKMIKASKNKILTHTGSKPMPAWVWEPCVQVPIVACLPLPHPGGHGKMAQSQWHRLWKSGKRQSRLIYCLC